MGCCGCVGGCLSCIGNTVFYFVNFLILLIGIALLCCGTIVIVSWECTIEKLLYQFYTAIGFPATTNTVDIGEFGVSVNAMAIILLSVGGFLVLVSLFAFLGLSPSLKVLEKISVFIFIILALALLAASIFVLVFICLPEKPDYLDFVGETMKVTMKNYKPTTGNTDSSQFSIEGALIDMIQSAFHCCGVSGTADYGQGGIIDLTARAWNMTLWGGSPTAKIFVPPTCCRTSEERSKSDVDSMDYHPDVDVSHFPKPTNIKAPTCYTDPAQADKLVHTVRKCPAAVYQMADTVKTEIIIISSVLIFVFIVIVVALFVKLCSSDKKKDGKGQDDKNTKPTAPPSVTQGPAAPAQPVSTIANYPSYPAYTPGAYPGYPPAGQQMPRPQNK